MGRIVRLFVDNSLRYPVFIHGGVTTCYTRDKLLLNYYSAIDTAAIYCAAAGYISVAMVRCHALSYPKFPCQFSRIYSIYSVNPPRHKKKKKKNIVNYFDDI